MTDAVEAVLAPIRRRYAELTADPRYVAGVLAEGAARVQDGTAEVVRRAQRAIGLLD